MLSFKHARWTKEQLKSFSILIHDSIIGCCAPNCWDRKFLPYKKNSGVPEPCRNCPYGRGINDLYELLRHVDEAVENSDETVEK